ncbi:MAG: methyltransferase domain-containing protein [Clostridia bacterium]|nr:methyltransferase domain-containing protein [Clostridia bacterium]
MMYANFAYVYDRLMQDIPYGQWVEYIFELYQRYGVKPRRVLDLGCGTGNVSLPLAQRGLDVVAVDLSPDMLAVADQKAFEQGLKVSFVQQDMRQLALPGSFDTILSMCDSLNYITEASELAEVFCRAANLLNPGGLFIFDLNTPYKLAEVFGDSTFTLLGEDVAYIWENNYLSEKGICQMDVTFFVREDNGLYRRFTEEHTEKGYGSDEIVEMIEKAGLEFLDSFAELTFNPPGPSTERVYYLAAKPKS